MALSRWGPVPAIADEAYDTLSMDVVERAISLHVEPLGRGAYEVTGGYEPHHVHLYDPLIPRCDCDDLHVRNRMCKHLTAVLIYVGDYRLWCRLWDLHKQANGV